jgi:hypothetical protein
MRLRTVILALGGVLIVNMLIVAGVWWWGRQETETASAIPFIAEDSSDASSENPPAIWVEPRPVADTPAVAVTPARPEPAPGADRAAFSTPRDGDSVERRFSASGSCASLPPRTQLMLVVDSGSRVFSPKLPPLTVNNGQWSGSVNEFGRPSGGSFSLCLYAVSDEAVAEFTTWHAQGKATGRYPPFRGTLPGSTELARIKLRVSSQ